MSWSIAMSVLAMLAPPELPGAPTLATQGSEGAVVSTQPAPTSEPPAVAPPPLTAPEAPQPVAETPATDVPLPPPAAIEAAPTPAAAPEIDPETVRSKREYRPFFEGPPVSETRHPTQARKGRTPVLSVGDGAFCFVESTYCRVSLIATAAVEAGMRLPSSEVGPDLPFAQFTFRGGVAVRPLMLGGRGWNPWGVGIVGSWSRGTGSVTIEGEGDDQRTRDTPHTDSVRIGAMNQLWLSRKPYALHLDLTLGAVKSEVLTSGVALWGTHAELGFGWDGWAALYASADFLDRDARLVFGFRGHGIAAGPVIALALAGLAIGGAL